MYHTSIADPERPYLHEAEGALWAMTPEHLDQLDDHEVIRDSDSDQYGPGEVWEKRGGRWCGTLSPTTRTGDDFPREAFPCRVLS